MVPLSVRSICPSPFFRDGIIAAKPAPWRNFSRRTPARLDRKWPDSTSPISFSC